MNKIILVCIFSFFYSTQLAYAEVKVRYIKKRVAILTFSANNVPSSVARIVRNTFELALFKTKKFDILERSRIDLILKERSIKMSECQTHTCAIKIGSILKADYVILGSVDKLAVYSVSVKVIDVNSKIMLLAETKDVNKLKDLKKGVSAITSTVSSKMNNPKKIKTLNNASFSISAHYFIPIGYYNSVVTYGFGFIGSAEIESFRVNHFSLGLEVGYFLFNGKDKNTNHIVMFPLLFSAEYEIALLNNFYIAPSVRAGFAYNSLYYYETVGEPETNVKSVFQPISNIAFKSKILITDSINMFLKIGHWNVFEQEGLVSFFSGAAGFNLIF